MDGEDRRSLWLSESGQVITLRVRSRWFKPFKAFKSFKTVKIFQDRQPNFDLSASVHFFEQSRRNTFEGKKEGRIRVLNAAANPHATLLWLEFQASAEGQKTLMKSTLPRPSILPDQRTRS
jgi:hypothetical protein